MSTLTEAADIRRTIDQRVAEVRAMASRAEGVHDDMHLQPLTAGQIRAVLMVIDSQAMALAHVRGQS